jgi:hypothetical protein
MRKLLAWFTVATAVGAAVACSSTATTMDAGPGPQVCPSTVVAATATGGDAGEGSNSSCHVDGFFQQAKCTCQLPSTGGTQRFFNCMLEADNSQVPPNQTDTTMLCKSVAVNGDAGVDPCPTDKTMATGTVCHNPGQLCDYTGVTCTGDKVPRTDTCQCNDNFSGDAGLSWMCDINACN